MSQYPDATLGRVQDGAYNSGQQALSSFRQGLSNDINSLNNIIGQWKERKELEKEAQKEREWKEAQLKIRNEHENNLADKRISFETEEGARNRAHKASENSKSIAAQQEMNAANNTNKLLEINNPLNSWLLYNDMVEKDKDNKVQIINGVYILNEKGKKFFEGIYNPANPLPTQQPQSTMERQ